MIQPRCSWTTSCLPSCYFPDYCHARKLPARPPGGSLRARGVHRRHAPAACSHTRATRCSDRTCSVVFLLLAQAVDHSDSGFVGFDLVIPHAEGKEDVRSHVLRMTGCGRNLRIDARGTQTERSVD